MLLSVTISPVISLRQHTRSMLTTGEIQVMNRETIRLKGKISISPLPADTYLNEFSFDLNSKLNLLAEDFHNGVVHAQTPACSTYSHDEASEVLVGTGDLEP